MPIVLKLRGAQAFSAPRLARLCNKTGVKLRAEHWCFVAMNGADNECHGHELSRLKNLLGIPSSPLPQPNADGELIAQKKHK